MVVFDLVLGNIIVQISLLGGDSSTMRLEILNILNFDWLNNLLDFQVSDGDERSLEILDFFCGFNSS